MVLILFEVTIKQDCMDSYLAVATRLREHLAAAEGFIRSERFSSLAHERKLLSLSLWESEEAVTAWRNQQQHRAGQLLGRDSLFEHYTITVAAPLRAYTDQDRQEAPADSNFYFENTTR